MSGGNLLLLDEPTNDLDVDTLRALEDALLDFAGCAVVISHDRWFLDRIATHILAFEGNCEVVWHEGNYQSYIEDLQQAEGRRRRPAAPRGVQEAGAGVVCCSRESRFVCAVGQSGVPPSLSALAVVSASARAQTPTTHRFDVHASRRLHRRPGQARKRGVPHLL